MSLSRSLSISFCFNFSNYKTNMNTIDLTNAALLAVLTYLLYNQFISRKTVAETESLPPIPPATKPEPRVFTPRELAKYDGKDGALIYLSIKGQVFDVSSRPDFYGPGSMYENFSGRDASRGMSKHSFDVVHLKELDEPIDPLIDLTGEEEEAMNEWHQFFSGKYPTIGTLVNENKA